MRNRLIEISAALIGVVIVVALYLDRGGVADNASAPGPMVQPSAPLPDIERPPAPERPRALELPGAAESVEAEPAGAAPEPAVETAEVAEARVIWETARAALEAVEGELEVLDQRFDAKEAELAEREARGLDPEALEEEMLIFLDGIVDEYDELETRLGEAEAAELAAAERLATLRGR
jgi:hypothetical protein